MGWVHTLQQAAIPPRVAQAAPQPAPAPAAPADVSGQKKRADMAAQVTALAARLQQAETRDQDNERLVAELKKRSELPRASALTILDTAAVVRGPEAQETPEPTAVPPSPLPYTLLLQGAKNGEESAGGRKAEIADAAGTKLRVEETLPSDQGYYALTLPAGFLKPGHRYTIRLQDAKSGKTRETFEIRVR
jgi:hypothetical protein